MQRGGFVLNAATYVSILNPCVSAGALEWVKEVHSHALKWDLSRICVWKLIHMYAQSGSIDDAPLGCDRMVERDAVTRTVMIGGIAQHGCGHEDLLLLRQMNAQGVRPDGVTFVATLSACRHVGLVDKVSGIKPTTEHHDCMVDLLGQAGHLRKQSSSFLTCHSSQMEQLGEPCLVLVKVIVMWNWLNLLLQRVSSWNQRMPKHTCPHQHLCCSWQVGPGVIRAHHDAELR